eukprot:6977125-Karenia_brevis.AAC.1
MRLGSSSRGQDKQQLNVRRGRWCVGCWRQYITRCGSQELLMWIVLVGILASAVRKRFARVLCLLLSLCMPAAGVDTM